MAVQAMTQSQLPTESGGAIWPDRRGTDRASRPERWRYVRRWVPGALLIACPCVACSHVAAYGGTASLQVSGVAGDQLAFQTVTFTSCRGSTLQQARGDTTSRDDRTDVFTIVALGDDCLLFGQALYGDPTWSTLQTGPANLCSLAFADGNHTLRVTDLALYFPGSRQYDYSFVVIRIGGDEVASGRHAVYEFSGRAVMHADESWRCDGTRQPPRADGG